MQSPWLLWLENYSKSAFVRDFFEAALTFVGVWFALHVLYRLVLKNLPAWVGRVRKGNSDLVARLVNAVHPNFFSLLAFFIALGRFELGSWQRRILEAFVAALILIQILLVLNRVIEDALSRLQTRGGNGKVEHAKSNLTALAKVILWGAALLFFFDNFGVNVSTFVAGLGIGGIAVALAAQAILGDTFGSFTISVDKPFDVGDSIKVGDLNGTVLDVGLRTTRIRALSGELWVVPNSDLTKSRLQNFSDMKERRAVFRLGLGYDTPTGAIKALTEEVKRLVESQPKTRFDRAHFMNFGESSLDIEVVWFMLSDSHSEYMDTQQRIYLALLDYCRDHAIDLAFPTRTLVLDSQTSETVLGHKASAPALPVS